MTEPSYRPEGADLSIVIDRIGRLEEAFSQLPGPTRTPQFQRAWIIACLRQIEWACEEKAPREGYAYDGERLRFYHVLIEALSQVDEPGSRPVLFAKGSEAARVQQSDWRRSHLQAAAAAILEPVGKGWRTYWADKIAAALSAAGLGGGKSSSEKVAEELSASTVKKWLARCKAGTHPSSWFYHYNRVRIQTSDFLAADGKTRAHLLNREIDRLGDEVALQLGHQKDMRFYPKDRKRLDRSRIDNFCRLAGLLPGEPCPPLPGADPESVSLRSRPLSDDELWERFGVALP